MPRPITRARGRLQFCTAVLIVTAVLLAGCSTRAVQARPVEEEQIKNVVKDYFVRSGSIPDYGATIEEVDGNWARVRIAPVGVNNVNGETILYLQKQNQTLRDAPPPTLDVQPGNQARVTTTSGWTIVAGPQAQFTEAELDAAGIPEAIRH
ncbi:MAG: hypothetical protein U0X20_15500 [Caldilineaceae bacterium]